MHFNLKRIKKIREDGHFKQELGAWMLERGRTTYTNKENGINPITIGELECFAAMFEVDPSEFFEFDGNEPILKNELLSKIEAEGDVSMSTIDSIVAQFNNTLAQKDKEIEKLKQRLVDLESKILKQNP